jgi:UDP-GlcNAc:undecaprenyl-phosphate GlcNAc-1-phosphate transferase
MRLEAALAAACGTAALSTYLLTPWAIRLALRTGFLDRPVGYKGHGRPTPYLGGLAILGGLTIAAVAFGSAASTYAVLLCCALALCALGTIDDRRNLSPWTRIAAEVAAGLTLWATGNGWDVLGSAPADGLLTVLWVLGVVNAFNLMDNMNGAAATCAAVSALGAAGLAGAAGQDPLAVLCLAVAGACAGFLPYNLARPSAVFMGDGGSMLLGTLVAGVAMAAASAGDADATAVLAAALIVGMVILDTTLVSVSRRRGGRPLLSGGRDHLTHRLGRRLGSQQHVPLVLAAGQAALCGVAIATVHAGSFWLLGAAIVAVGAGACVVWVLEGPGWLEQDSASPSQRGDRAGEAVTNREAVACAGDR